MEWMKLYTTFHDHPKTVELGAKRCWPCSLATEAGTSTRMTPGTSRGKRLASWVSGRRRGFRARGQRWEHRGRRTIEWRWRQRSWSPDLASRPSADASTLRDHASPCSSAYRVAALRLPTPIFLKIDRRWAATVWSLR
jgi:hypothetical protein